MKDAIRRTNGALLGKRVSLHPLGPLQFARDADGLAIDLPERKPNEIAYCFKITPAM